MKVSEQPKIKPEKPLVKLLTFWKAKYSKPGEVHSFFVSHGIWQTVAVEFKKGARIYTLRCVMPFHPDLKVGDTRRLWEEAICALCFPVQIITLPAIEFKE